MYYTTLEEFNDQIQPELASLTSNDSATTPNDATITECIEYAETYINAYIGKSYDIKKIRNVVNTSPYIELRKLLSRLTFVIARYFLYSRKDAVNEGSSVQNEYNDIIEMLEGFGEGKLKLPEISMYTRNAKTYGSGDTPVLNTKGFKEFGNYEYNRQN